MNIVMTKEEIINEINELTCDENAIQYAITHYDLEMIVNDLIELNCLYENVNNYLRKSIHVYDDMPKKLTLETTSIDYAFELRVLDIKYRHYSTALAVDSEVMCDFIAWYDCHVYELQRRYDNRFYSCNKSKKNYEEYGYKSKQQFIKVVFKDY